MRFGKSCGSVLCVQCDVTSRAARCLRLSHIAHTARCAADGHARLQVVDAVGDERDEDEEDEDDEEDDDVALHFGGWGAELEV